MYCERAVRPIRNGRNRAPCYCCRMRANYVLDQWNSPYWVRHKCGSGRVTVFIYSFGPNRQRDSSEWEILGDDIGMRLAQDR